MEENNFIIDKNILNCPICTNMMYLPRLYDCGHSLCEYCMIKMDETENKAYENFEDVPIYKCPICRKVTHKSWYNRPKNLFFMDILNNNEKYSEQMKDIKYQEHDLENVPEDIDLTLICKRSKDLKFNELYNYIIPIIYKSCYEGMEKIIISERTKELYELSSLLAEKLFSCHKIYKVISTPYIFKIIVVKDGDNSSSNNSGRRTLEYINNDYINTSDNYSSSGGEEDNIENDSLDF